MEALCGGIAVPGRPQTIHPKLSRVTASATSRHSRPRSPLFHADEHTYHRFPCKGSKFLGGMWSGSWHGLVGKEKIGRVGVRGFASKGGTWERVNNFTERTQKRAAQVGKDTTDKVKMWFLKLDAKYHFTGRIKAGYPRALATFREFRKTPVGNILSYVLLFWLFTSGIMWRILSFALIGFSLTSVFAPFLLRGKIEELQRAAQQQQQARMNAQYSQQQNWYQQQQEQARRAQQQQQQQRYNQRGRRNPYSSSQQTSQRRKSYNEGGDAIDVEADISDN